MPRTLIETGSPPSITEPITTEEAMQFLRVPILSPPDADEEGQIDTLISAAREQGEAIHGKDLAQRQYDLLLHNFPGYHCPVELRANTSSVDLVEYTDSDGTATTLVEDTDYITDLDKQPAIIRPLYGESWPSFTPWPTSAVRIRFTCGYTSSTIPNHLQTGLLCLIKWLYDGDDRYKTIGESMLSLGRQERA